jgi:uncharacterized protein YukE
LDKVLDYILAALEFVYGRPWLALCALVVMFAWAGAIIYFSHRRNAPYLRAAQTWGRALEKALGSAIDPVETHRSFSENFVEAAGALEGQGTGAAPLAKAWREYRETILDEGATPIRAAAHPGPYFQRSMPRFPELIFASNAFVAAGLILTFIGLVVALHTAAGNMGDADKAKSALTLLLTVASAKFLTSIGGIGSSLWLRFAEHGLAKKVNLQTQKICTLLEQGLVYVSPQRLTAEQLEILKEQRDQLKFFNTDVALQLSERIGVQFQNAVAPIAASLSELNDNMTSMGQGLGQGAAKAVEEASGGELRALGQTLATLGERLDLLSASVGQSGQDAANQIRAAGADFANAAADIRTAFDKLATQVDGMGGKLVEQGEIAAQAHDAALQRVLESLEHSQSKSAGAMANMVEALEAAGAQAAATMQREVSGALTNAVAESQRTFRMALDESGEALRDTSAGLAQAVAGAATQIERAASEFGRSSESASRTTQALEGIANESRTVARSIGEAGASFTSAAAPISQATSSISETVGRLSRTIEVAREANVVVLSELKTLAAGIRDTQSAAEAAWSDYRARFEGVDRSLASTTTKLGETLGDSFERFRDFAVKFDSEMASAVSKLGNALNQIEEYAGALDEYVDHSRKANGGARS